MRERVPRTYALVLGGSTVKIWLLLSHSEEGGAANIWADASEGLARRGHDTRLMALYPGPRAGNPPRFVNGAPIWHVWDAPPRGAWSFVSKMWAFVRAIRRERPDVILTALPAANVITAVAAFAAMGATRVVTSHHGPDALRRRTMTIAEIAAESLPSVRGIVTVSRTLLASFSRRPRSYRQKCTAIGNALPPDIARHIDEIRVVDRSIAPRSGRLVVACRLADQKNLGQLIAAVAQIPDCRLDVVGDGPERASLEAQAERLGVTDRVSFLGNRSRTDALAMVNTSDVFVQVSRAEGHSLALLEAFRLGLPVVVSDIPEQVEAIQMRSGDPAGLVVPLDDALALAQALEQLLSKPSVYAQWATRSLAQADETDFESQLEAYERLLISIVPAMKPALTRPSAHR